MQTRLRSSPHAPKQGAPDNLSAVEKFRRKMLDELRERAFVEVML